MTDLGCSVKEKQRVFTGAEITDALLRGSPLVALVRLLSYPGRVLWHAVPIFGVDGAGGRLMIHDPAELDPRALPLGELKGGPRYNPWSWEWTLTFDGPLVKRADAAVLEPEAGIGDDRGEDATIGAMKVGIEVGSMPRLVNDGVVVSQHIGTATWRGGASPLREEDENGQLVRRWSGEMLEAFRAAAEGWDLLRRDDVVWIRYPAIGINALRFNRNGERTYVPLRGEFVGLMDQAYAESDFAQLSREGAMSRLRGGEMERDMYSSADRMRAEITAAERRRDRERGRDRDDGPERDR